MKADADADTYIDRLTPLTPIVTSLPLRSEKSAPASGTEHIDTPTNDSLALKLLHKLKAAAEANDLRTTISSSEISLLITSFEKKLNTKRELGKNSIVDAFRRATLPGTAGVEPEMLDFLLSNYAAPSRKKSGALLKTAASKLIALSRTTRVLSASGKPTSPESLKPTSSALMLKAMSDSIPTEAMLKLTNALELIDRWSFDSLAIGELCATPLAAIGHALFNHRGLATSLAINDAHLHNFLNQVESRYLANPYHNAMHGADVAQTVHALLSPSMCHHVFPQHIQMAGIVAGLIHDVGHQGTTNSYLIVSSHKQAIRYNDQSPLENMHAAKGFKIINKPDCAILSTLPKDQALDVRQIVIEMVLATDNAFHAKHMGDLITSLSKPKGFDFNDRHDEILFLQTALHAADISNPTKQWDMYLSWTGRIMQEFYAQGDLERENGYPVTPIFDRRTAKPMHQFQTGFILGLVQPLYTAYAEIPGVNISEPLRNIRENMEEWASQAAAAKSPKAGLATAATSPPPVAVAVPASLPGPALPKPSL